MKKLCISLTALALTFSAGVHAAVYECKWPGQDEFQMLSQDQQRWTSLEADNGSTCSCVRAEAIANEPTNPELVFVSESAPLYKEGPVLDCRQAGTKQAKSCVWNWCQRWPDGSIACAK